MSKKRSSSSKKGQEVIRPGTSVPGGCLAPLGPVCSHRGEQVRVGPYAILAGGTRYLQPEDLERADIVVPLEASVPARLGQRVEILACPWRDYGPPPAGFEDFLRDQVVPELAAGRKLLVYCIGSHGRTGSFLASLISLLEPETVDPIVAARERHCKKAVESREQAEAIFALRGLPLPPRYAAEFFRPPPPPLGGPSIGSLLAAKPATGLRWWEET